MFDEEAFADHKSRYEVMKEYRSTLEWKELLSPEIPEGGLVPVFCEKCQTKNRYDEGWRYVSVLVTVYWA